MPSSTVSLACATPAQIKAETQACDLPETRLSYGDAMTADPSRLQLQQPQADAAPTPSAPEAQGPLLSNEDLSQLFSAPHDSAAELCSSEDAHLSSFSDDFRKFAAACTPSAGATDCLAPALCVTSMRWIYHSLVYKGRVYMAIGLGGSGSSHPHAIKWLKKVSPPHAEAMELSLEYCKAMPCLKKRLPPGRLASADFLKMSRVGQFQNTGGLRDFVKVLRAAFVDILTLHVLRTAEADPPEGYGCSMHQTGSPGSGVKWDWSLLTCLIPSTCDAERSSFEVSSMLWAALLTGVDNWDKRWSWVAWLSAQVLSNPAQPLKGRHLRHDLGCGTSITVLPTDRHKPSISREPRDSGGGTRRSSCRRRKTDPCASPGLAMNGWCLLSCMHMSMWHKLHECCRIGDCGTITQQAVEAHPAHAADYSRSRVTATSPVAQVQPGRAPRPPGQLALHPGIHQPCAGDVGGSAVSMVGLIHSKRQPAHNSLKLAEMSSEYVLFSMPACACGKLV